MGQWQHLFIDGEFMSRARLLSGLTVEQVSVRPPGLPHSIYEELWHTTNRAWLFFLREPAGSPSTRYSLAVTRKVDFARGTTGDKASILRQLDGAIGSHVPLYDGRAGR